MFKTILLTGGTGFLGSHLLARLVAAGFKIIVLKRAQSSLKRIQIYLDEIQLHDIEKGLEPIFQHNSIDVIIHCATQYGRTHTLVTELIQANLVLPLELLQLAEHYHIKAFINTDTQLDKNINHYARSKKQFSEWLPSFAHQLICIDIALEHFYGAFDDETKFVTRLIKQLLGEVERIDLTLGEQQRDFIYIDDVVRAFMKIIDTLATLSKEYYRFEVGSGQPIMIRELVQMIKSLTGNQLTQLAFGALAYRQHELMISQVNISPLLKLGWQPQVPLTEGLKQTIQLERSQLNR